MGHLQQQGPRQGDPQLLDRSDQQGKRSDVLVLLQLSLHDRPEILNWVKIRAVARPVHHGDLCLLEESHNFFASMARRSVLEKVCHSVVAHPEHQLLLQHVHVALAVHRGLGWKKIQGAMPPCPGETPPHHDAC